MVASTADKIYIDSDDTPSIFGARARAATFGGFAFPRACYFSIRTNIYVEPIRIINKELQSPVGVFNPHTSDTAARVSRAKGLPLQNAKPSIELRKVAKFTRDITSEGPDCHMARSQFPVQIIDAAGRTITKPAAWESM